MSIQLAQVQLDSKPTVNELSVALKKITEWKTFAVSLSQRIEPHHITEIQANESTISERKLALYMKWLQVCPDAKWSDVVTALKAIDEHALADTLTGSTGGTSHTYSTTDTPIEEGVTKGTHPTEIDSQHGITQQLQTTGTITKSQMTQKMINFPTTTEQRRKLWSN